MKIRFLFAWYDLWIGAYWDRQNRRLYVLPLPCVGIVIQFPRTFAEEITEKSGLALWQSYCDVKMERDALKERNAKLAREAHTWWSALAEVTKKTRS